MSNETYEIEVRSPLLRPGITIRTTVSQKYVKTTVLSLLDICREMNTNSNTELKELKRLLYSKQKII